MGKILKITSVLTFCFCSFAFGETPDGYEEVARKDGIRLLRMPEAIDTCYVMPEPKREQARYYFGTEDFRDEITAIAEIRYTYIQQSTYFWLAFSGANGEFKEFEKAVRKPVTVTYRSHKYTGYDGLKSRDRTFAKDPTEAALQNVLWQINAFRLDKKILECPTTSP